MACLCQLGERACALAPQAAAAHTHRLLRHATAAHVNLPPQELARKRRKIPESDFKDGPDGLKLYDLVVGAGAEAKPGERVAIHYDVKFRNGECLCQRAVATSE